MESSNAQKFMHPTPNDLFKNIFNKCVPVSVYFLTFCFLLLEDDHYESDNIKQNIKIQIYK